MLLNVNVKATGHGLGYNKYKAAFSFLISVEDDFFSNENDEDLDRINPRARIQARKQLAAWNWRL